MSAILASIVDNFSTADADPQALHKCLVALMPQLDFFTGTHPVQVCPALHPISSNCTAFHG